MSPGGAWIVVNIKPKRVIMLTSKRLRIRKNTFDSNTTIVIDLPGRDYA